MPIINYKIHNCILSFLLFTLLDFFNLIRNAEKQFVAESDEIEPGTEWDRISKLCDFNPKSSRASKDVTRMRSIILQLKQTPLKKPVPPTK